MRLSVVYKLGKDKLHLTFAALSLLTELVWTPLVEKSTVFSKLQIAVLLLPLSYLDEYWGKSDQFRLWLLDYSRLPREYVVLEELAWIHNVLKIRHDLVHFTKISKIVSKNGQFLKYWTILQKLEKSRRKVRGISIRLFYILVTLLDSRFARTSSLVFGHITMK